MTDSGNETRTGKARGGHSAWHGAGCKQTNSLKHESRPWFIASNCSSDGRSGLLRKTSCQAFQKKAVTEGENGIERAEQSREEGEGKGERERERERESNGGCER